MRVRISYTVEVQFTFGGRVKIISYLCQALWSGFYFCEGIMKNYKSLHILSTLILNLALLIIAFSTENPYIIFSVLALTVTTLFRSGNKKKLYQGLIYFIPFSIITTIINMIFVQEGRIILLNFMGKNFTLEALTYALLLSIKLLVVIYIFMLLGIMIDSDTAVAYFSNKLPKSTLMIMVSIKLFPTMGTRLKTLREIYSIRGAVYEGRTLKDKIKGFIPVFSVLLEDSLEGAFDIGEAAYVRGFLSGRRSVYDKQKYKLTDYAILLFSLSSLILFLFLKIMGKEVFNIYETYNLLSAINSGIVAEISIVFLMILLLDVSASKWGK